MNDTIQLPDSTLNLAFIYFSDSGQFWSVTDGTWKDWDDAEFSAGDYDVVTSKKGTKGLYLAVTPPEVAPYRYGFSVVDLSTREVIGSGSYDSADLIVSLLSAVRIESGLSLDSIFGSGQSALTSVAYLQNFFGEGFDSSGWTKFVFTLKSSKESQDDSEALLTIRVSNPPDATDGISVWRGQPVTPGAPLQTGGTLFVTLTGTDTNIAVAVSADGMNLDPSPNNAPFSYEIDRWVGNTKIPMGFGDFVLTRSVRRGTVAP